MVFNWFCKEKEEFIVKYNGQTIYECKNEGKYEKNDNEKNEQFKKECLIKNYKFVNLY